MSDHNLVVTKQERWITQVNGGVVASSQRISSDAFVISANELPSLISNPAYVSNELVLEIEMAIKYRVGG